MQTSTPLNLTSSGVYLQEIPPEPDRSLVTGIPVFLGVTQPISHSVSRSEETIAVSSVSGASSVKMLTLWTQFVQYFDDSATESYLSAAVRGFFESGGLCCYVIPLENHSREALEAGLRVAEPLNHIDLVCAPDVVRHPPNLAVEMQAMVLEHCDRMGDRFAILDAFNVTDATVIDTLLAQKRRLIGDNGALYAPWLKVESAANYIPPCGHVAGIYAFNDRTVGSYRAPANYLLEAVLDLSYSFADSHWQTLNPALGAGINCIRSFRSRGIRVWGARTLSQNPDWRYVNIRRTKITLLRWAEQHLADVVFEPNNSTLWGRLSRELTVYCETLWEQGAIQGRTPDEAFYIKCDDETNPPQVRDLGQVMVEIGLAFTTPAEFIVLSIVHGSSGVTLIQSDSQSRQILSRSLSS